MALLAAAAHAVTQQLQRPTRWLRATILSAQEEQPSPLRLSGALPEVADSTASDRPGNAALFHSIYGTEGFQGYKLPLSHREEIAELCAAGCHPR